MLISNQFIERKIVRDFAVVECLRRTIGKEGWRDGENPGIIAGKGADRPIHVLFDYP